jgi:hypothetical protein
MKIKVIPSKINLNSTKIKVITPKTNRRSKKKIIVIHSILPKNKPKANRKSRKKKKSVSFKKNLVTEIIIPKRGKSKKIDK